MRLVIKVWLLPDSSEAVLRAFHRAVINALGAVEGLDIHGEDDVICLFPADMMRYGLGNDVLIEIDGYGVIGNTPERANDLIGRLHAVLSAAVRASYPKIKVVDLSLSWNGPSRWTKSNRG